MRILIDTHLLLWWLTNSGSLTRQARKLIADPENTIFVSAVSLWEIWLKVSMQKLEVPGDFEALLAEESFESLPLTAIQARGVANLPWVHRDPFDRMLVAQARADGLTLLTGDERMSAYGDGIVLVR